MRHNKSAHWFSQGKKQFIFFCDWFLRCSSKCSQPCLPGVSGKYVDKFENLRAIFATANKTNFKTIFQLTPLKICYNSVSRVAESNENIKSICSENNVNVLQKVFHRCAWTPSANTNRGKNPATAHTHTLKQVCIKLFQSPFFASFPMKVCMCKVHTVLAPFRLNMLAQTAHSVEMIQWACRCIHYTHTFMCSWNAKQQTVEKVSFEVAYCEWVNESVLLKWAATMKKGRKKPLALAWKLQCAHEEC